MTFYLIFALLIALVAVVFALQNFIPVTVTFLLWDISGSLALVLLLTLALGILIGLLVAAPGLVRRQLKVSSHRKTISKLEKELETHKGKAEETDMEPEKGKLPVKPEDWKG